MGFMDKVKETADKVGNKIEKGFKNVSDSSQKLSDKMKLKKQIGQLEADVDAAYNEIGKKFFAANSSAPSAEYAEKFSEITAKNEQIEALRNELNALEDKFNCPGCGALLMKGQSFCDKCGINVSAFSSQGNDASSEMHCVNCGSVIYSHQKFCEKCGTAVNSSVSEVEHVQGEVVDNGINQ